MKKFAIMGWVLLLCTACSPTKPTPTDSVYSSCVRSDNLILKQRVSTHKLMVQSGNAVWNIGVANSCTIPSHIDRLTVADRFARIRYIEGFRGQRIPALERTTSSNVFCAQQNPILVLFDKPLMWSIVPPVQCRIQSIERITPPISESVSDR